ncbi:MAG TPA: AraC family transcriptional regulator [Desulfotomaculum sp.]|nr:AraC family transcriptional regulator [Desulfotomaculum sp.]
MKIELKTIEEKQVVYIAQTGPAEEMGVLFGEILAWVMEKGLQMAGPPLSIYPNQEKVSPEEMEYEAGVPIVGEVREEGRIKIKRIPAQQVLTTIHKGPYREIEPVYKALMEYIMKNVYEIVGAPMEIYLNDPREVPESELLTEVQFPVLKK